MWQLQWRKDEQERLLILAVVKARSGKKAYLKRGADEMHEVVFEEGLTKDTYQNTALIYDVRLSVLDATGKVIAEGAKQGRDDLGGSFMNPPAHAKTAVPVAFRRIFEGLLNDPKVIAALRT
jgi:hypothetical protein